jgi:hypothetical protein
MKTLSYKKFKLQEKKIASLRDTIEVVLDVDLTKHAEERKLRHEKPISEKEILISVNKALDRIIERQLKGYDRIHQKYWIYDKDNDDLNVILEFKRYKGDVKLVIITIMREPVFHGSKDAIKLKV